MRLNELKPNTEYATCDGHLVVTGDTVEGGFYSYYITQDGTEKYEIAKGDPRKTGTVEGADPWAKCSTGRTTGNIRYSTKGGVKVTRYDFDRDGKRRADGPHKEIVVKPADIPGLWSEYVTLHADRILGRFLMDDLQRQASSARTMLGGILRNNKVFPQRSAPTRWSSMEGEAIEIVVAPLVSTNDDGGHRWKSLSHATSATKVVGTRIVPSVTISGEENIDALLRLMGKSPIFTGQHWMVYYQTGRAYPANRKYDKTLRIVADSDSVDEVAAAAVRQVVLGRRKFTIIDIVAVDISGQPIYPTKEVGK